MKIFNRSSKIIFLLFLALFLISAHNASAALVYPGTYVDMYLKQFPDLEEQKIFLDKATAATITGHVGSQEGTVLVLLSSTTDLLNQSADGFANIKANDGYLNNITITVPGYYFEDLIFSVNLTPNSQTDFSVTATASGGSYTYSNWSTEEDWSPGENRILLLSKLDDLMVSATIDSKAGLNSIGGIDQIKQIEISGLTPVPIPAAVWLLGSGLVGLVAIRRRFKK